MFGGVGVSKVYYNDLWSYQISTNKYPRLASLLASFSFSSSSRLLPMPLSSSPFEALIAPPSYDFLSA